MGRSFFLPRFGGAVQRSSCQPGKSPEHCIHGRVPRNSTVRCSQIVRSYIGTNWSRVMLQRSIHISGESAQSTEVGCKPALGLSPLCRVESAGRNPGQAPRLIFFSRVVTSLSDPTSYGQKVTFS